MVQKFDNGEKEFIWRASVKCDRNGDNFHENYTSTTIFFLKDLNTEFRKNQPDDLIVKARSQKHSWRTDVTSTQAVFFSA